MNNEPIKPEWERHHDDEAAARAVQQASAGPTHEPVNGPGRYGDERTNAAVAEAVMRERERCAAIVEACAGGDVNAEWARRVAAMIRAEPGA